MFFEKESISFNILDVLYLDQKDISVYNSGRNFNALSFRYRAETVLKTEKQKHYITDNFVSYIPSRLEYSRISKKDELIVIHFDTTNYNTKNIECFKSESPEKLAELFRNILNQWNEKEIGYKFTCSAILCEIFAECYKQNYTPEDKFSKIDRSIGYIHQNYRNSELTIKEIADR